MVNLLHQQFLVGDQPVQFGLVAVALVMREQQGALEIREFAHPEMAGDQGTRPVAIGERKAGQGFEFPAEPVGNEDGEPDRYREEQEAEDQRALHMVLHGHMEDTFGHTDQHRQPVPSIGCEKSSAFTPVMV